MNKTKYVAVSTLLMFVFAAAQAQSQEVSWRQVVGIILAGNVVGSGTGAVTGGFLPWTTTSGEARVNLDNGEIHFVVRGLVFAAGGQGVTIGTPAPVTAVKGTLVCNVSGSANGGNSVLVSTPSVRLSAAGDARFNGKIGPLPSICSEPDLAFLITVSGFGGNPVANGPWIANGAVLLKGNPDHGDR